MKENNSMKKLALPIHSVVDVITNSSTQIYVQFNESALTTVKELIDNLLSIGGSILKSDDLFEFEIYDESLEDDRYQHCEEYCSDEGIINDSTSWEDQEPIIKEQLERFKELSDDEKPDWWYRGHNDDYEEEYYSTQLICKCKDNIIGEQAIKVAEILSKLKSLFHIEAQAQY
jgi:hypothetical protein